MEEELQEDLAGEQMTGVGHGRGRGQGEAEGEREGGAGRGRGQGAGGPNTNSHASSAIGKKKLVTRGTIVNLRFRHLAIYLRCDN